MQQRAVSARAYLPILGHSVDHGIVARPRRRTFADNCSVAVRRPQLFRRVCSREYRSFVAQGVNRLGARDRQRVSEHRRQRDEKY